MSEQLREVPSDFMGEFAPRGEERPTESNYAEEPGVHELIFADLEVATADRLAEVRAELGQMQGE